MARRIPYLIGLIAGVSLLVLPPATLKSQTPAPAIAPDMLQLTAEAQTWLTDLLRINTTNPPGNEMEAAKYIQAVLQKENIPAEILEMRPGRGIVVARLQAGPLPDSAKALLLVAHLDVVGVDRAKWSVDPFAAVQKDNGLTGAACACCVIVESRPFDFDELTAHSVCQSTCLPVCRSTTEKRKAHRK